MSDSIQWLDDFNQALHMARSVASSIDRNGEILSLSGNTVMGHRLTELAGVLGEALDNADAAISRMVSEQVQDSFRQTNETFVALLKSISDTAAEMELEDGHADDNG
jgi:hypothetical protein